MIFFLDTVNVKMFQFLQRDEDLLQYTVKNKLNSIYDLSFKNLKKDTEASILK